MAQTNVSKQVNERLVELFTLDCTPFGGGIIRVCNSRLSSGTILSEASVVFDGNIYICIPFEALSFKRGGERAEKAKLIIPDGYKDFWNQMVEIGGAPGARVTRYVILGDDLEADEAPLCVDRYLLDNVGWDGGKLTFELNAPHAFRKTAFPAHEMRRDVYEGLGEQLLR